MNIIKKRIKVSVITPAYNAEKYISQTIEGILSQSFSDFEYIIVNDCSTDRTLEIINDYAKKDSRIAVFSNEKNLGIAGTRNKGVSLANGEYVVWQDADDISMPRRIENQVKYMENHPKVGICGGFLEFFNDMTADTSVRRYAADDKMLRSRIFRYSPVAQPAAIIRKKCLDEFGKYNLKYPPAEDLDMSFRIGTKYEFANIQEIVIRYREHPSSATFSKLKTIELNTIEIRKKYLDGVIYRMSFMDKIYNFCQFISIFIVPPKVKIKLFNFIRNK